MGHTGSHQPSASLLRDEQQEVAYWGFFLKKGDRSGCQQVRGYTHILHGLAHGQRMYLNDPGEWSSSLCKLNLSTTNDKTWCAVSTSALRMKCNYFGNRLFSYRHFSLSYALLHT